MEDAHSYVFDYAGVRGQGFFAVFDGHAGKEAADWCGQNFHEVSLKPMALCPATSVMLVLVLAPHSPSQS
jgi:protein phosphatase PTC1